MLIDTLMPRGDFSERHSISVRAAPHRIFDAIRTADLTSSRIVRALLTLRGMGTTRRRIGEFNQGFSVVGEDAPRELVLGIEGPFWRPDCILRSVTRETFDEPVPSGVARAVWNFSVDGGRLTTETRILCADDARAKFRFYWTFIRPFSGLIRRMMLRTIRDEAER